MSTWNYRVIEFGQNTEAGEHQERPWRAIHEVYYDDQGRPVSYSGVPAVISWHTDESDATPHAMLERIREALSKPVLLESNFHTDKSASISPSN